MSDLVAGNSFIKDAHSACLDAIHADTIIDAVNAQGVNCAQTTQHVGHHADASSQRGFHHADGTAQRMALAELDAIGKVGDDVCESSRDGIAATERLGLENLRASERAGDRAVASSERFGLFNNGSIERSADKTQNEVEKFGLRELDAITSAEKYLYAGMSQNAKDLMLQACGNAEKVMHQSAEHLKDLLLQNCHDTASIKMQAEVLGKDAALAARDLMHQADKNTAAIQLEAFRHKDDLARQIAECCCEQKALTLETSHHTQDLVRKLDEQRLRDELAKTREELIALRVRSTLSPSLVASVPL